MTAEIDKNFIQWPPAANIDQLGFEEWLSIARNFSSNGWLYVYCWKYVVMRAKTFIVMCHRTI